MKYLIALILSTLSTFALAIDCSLPKNELHHRCYSGKMELYQIQVESFYRGDVFGGYWPSEKAFNYFYERQVDFSYEATKQCRVDKRCLLNLYRSEAIAIEKKKVRGTDISTEAMNNMKRKFKVLYHSDSAIMVKKFGRSSF